MKNTNKGGDSRRQNYRHQLLIAWARDNRPDIWEFACAKAEEKYPIKKRLNIKAELKDILKGAPK